VLPLLSLLTTRLTRSQAGRLLVAGAVCLLGGAGAFAATQHVSFGTGVYWAITTATTVGYGDVTPKNGIGRAIAALTMLTTIPLFASAFAVFAGAVAATHIRKLLDVVEPEAHGAKVVILGWHPSVPRLVAELARTGRPVLVVTNADTSALPDRVRVVKADPTSEETLRRLKLPGVSQLLIASSSDADTLVVAVLARQVAPGVPTLAITHSRSVATALTDLGVAATVSADELLAHTLAKSLEAPHAGELLLRLVDSEGYQMREVPIDPEQAGLSLGEVRRSHPDLVLGAVHDDRVVLGVSSDPTLAAGDRLLVVRADRRESRAAEVAHG
jgi:voltage-gated potassium channel